MTTGDLKNNLRKLQTELRAVKYSADVDFESLGNGVASSFLPIYHYVFIDYSRPVVEKLAAMQIELCGKTDLRFIEAMFKVLREMFAYKPPLTKEQFFAAGFGERKVIMCTQVLQLVRSKHHSLCSGNGVSRSTSTKRRPNPNHTLPAVLGASSEILRSHVHDDLSEDGRIGGTRAISEARMPTVIREVTATTAAKRPASADEDQLDRSLTDGSPVTFSNPADHSHDGNTMLGAVNKIADAVHLLSVRVDSIDRRLAQLEAVDRRMSELSITNPQLNDFSRLQQRVTDLEQTLLTSGTDSGAVNVDGHGTDGDRLDVVHSVTKGVDTLTKQMNNLTARMTLAENQLMLQSSSRRQSMFPEPTSCCVQFPSITDDDSSTDVNNHCIPIDHSNKAEGRGYFQMVDGFTEQSCSDNEDSTMKEPVVGTSARSEQLERIETMLRGTEDMLQKRSDLSLT